jgi:hypothetical protein
VYLTETVCLVNLRLPTRAREVYMSINQPQPPPRPTWVKISLIIVLVVVVVVVVKALAGGGHGPGRHLPGGDGEHNPPVEHNAP